MLQLDYEENGLGELLVKTLCGERVLSLVPAMADQTVKKPLNRSQCDDPDLEPAKRKRSCSPGTAHSSESSSPLQHTGRKHSCQTTVSLRNERKRLLYVMQQILAAKNT